VSSSDSSDSSEPLEVQTDALAAAENHSEATILLFLRQLLIELERRRPWPDPALMEVDPDEWPSLGSSLPIAWLEPPMPMVQEAVKASFTAESDTDMPLLVLRGCAPANWLPWWARKVSNRAAS